MLEALGVTESDEAVYRALLAAPRQTVTDLARRLERSTGATRRSVTDLSSSAW